MDYDKRLEELGLVLPKPTAPLGTYLKAVRTGNLLFVSGHGPHQDGVLRYQGQVGKEVTLEEAYAAARLTMLNCLATIRIELGSLNRVRRIVKVFGLVNCVPGFGDQPKVINGGSDLLVELFGEAGRHARSAVGAPALPSNIPVEIEMIVEVAEGN